MASDLIDWVKGFGVWIMVGISWIDALYKKIKTSGGLKFVLDFLIGPIAALFGGQEDLLGVIITILKQVVGFLSWLWDTLKSGFAWLQNAMPGAKKDAAQKDLQKEIDKTTKGLRVDDGQGGMTDAKITYAGKGKWTENMANGSVKTLDSKGLTELLQQSYAKTLVKGDADARGKTNADKLTKLGDKFDKAPSVFDNVVTAINGLTAAILGWGKQNLKDTFLPPPKAPGSVPLSNTDKAIVDNPVSNWFQSWLPNDNTNSPVNVQPPAFVAPTATGSEQIVNGQTKDQYITELRNNDSTISQTTIDRLVKERGFYASGASFSKSGLFMGNVHAPEEIPPLATTIKGPGILARAIDALGNAQQSDSVGGRSTIQQNTYQIDASQHIGTVSTEIDIAKMRRAMRSELDDIFNRKARQAGS